MNVEWLTAFAQASDTPNGLKFITKKQKNFYETIDRFYQLERVNKTACRYTVRSKHVVTVHGWVSHYENTQTPCGSPTDGYADDGNWTNMR